MPITKLLSGLPNRTMDQPAFDAAMAKLMTDLPVWGDEVNATASSMGIAASGSAYKIPYKVDLGTTMADPTAGWLRLNASSQNAATAIVVDTIGSDNIDYTTLMGAFDDSTSAVLGTLRIEKIGDATKFLVFNLTAMTTPTGYRQFTVVCVGSSATSPFVQADLVVLSFQRTGDKGDLNTYPTVYVRDEKPSNTNGGTPSAAGSWIDRTLNTMVVNTASASLSGNAVTLPAGKWEYEGSAPAYGVNANQARLLNATDSTVLGVGTSENSHATYMNTTRSILRGEFTLAAAKAVKVQHFVATATTGGLGALANTGAVEVYTEIRFKKVA